MKGIHGSSPRRALIRDKEQGWQLLDNPARLRIQTIDSLCTTLARQMPILSRFGSVPTIAEDAEPTLSRGGQKHHCRVGI